MELSIKDVEIQDGVLKFASKEHLKKVTQEIGTMTEMESWNVNFNSLLKRQNSITAEEYDQIGSTGDFGDLGDLLYLNGKGDDAYIDKIIPDPRFAAVLNSNGYIIVNDSLYHIGLEVVNVLPLNKGNIAVTEFLANPNTNKSESIDLKSNQNSNLRVADVDYILKIYDKRRVRAQWKKHYAVVYESLVVRALFEKKNWVGWSSTNANSLSLSASGTYNQGPGYGIPFSGSTSGTWVSERTIFVDESASGVSTNWGERSGHVIVGYDGATESFSF